MRLYNQRSLSVEAFAPQGRDVTIYVCGITPYDTTHLGHAFTYASFDVLIRYLEYRGHTVRYAQNVTDIDDDILRKAREVGEDWRELGDRWTRHFIRDMIALNVRPPDYYPRATDVVPGIITSIQKLLAAGVAYPGNGSVYYDVDRWPDFGELSHIPRGEMLAVANERGNRPDDPYKRHPLDFVLWQAQAPGEPAWDSPWGPGRPGWHIECSTMATQLLAPTIDIHGGGADLVFPHHECEIAQALPVTGQPAFARFWTHTAMVRHDGEKMSKSLGNLVMIRDLLKDWSPDALRAYLAAHHYRDVWSYDEGELAAAAGRAQRLKDAATAAGGSAGDNAALDPAPFTAALDAAMADDLNTGAALDSLDELAQATLAGSRAGHDVRAAQHALRDLGHLFGLRLDSEAPEDRVQAGWQKHLQRFS